MAARWLAERRPDMITHIVETYCQQASVSAAMSFNNLESKQSGLKSRRKLVELACIDPAKSAQGKPLFRMPGQACAWASARCGRRSCAPLSIA